MTLRELKQMIDALPDDALDRPVIISGRVPWTFVRVIGVQTIRARETLDPFGDQFTTSATLRDGETRDDRAEAFHDVIHLVGLGRLKKFRRKG